MSGHVRSHSINRILFLCPDLHETGGIGAVARMALRGLESYSALSDCTGEVWCFAKPATDANGDGSTWLHRYAYRSKGRFAFWGLRASARDASRTFIVSMHLHLGPAVLPLLNRGARLATVLHGTEAWIPVTGLRAKSLARSQIVISVSRFTAERFQRANPGLVGCDVSVCLLGAPPAATAALPPTEAKPFALIVGRISSNERYKGHDQLLELWTQVVGGTPEARLVVAGDGDDRERLEQKAHRLGLSGAVSFLGRVDDETLQALYRDCSFFVMPSSREGFGLVFLEAMRAGKPCIGGEGAPAEIIQDGVTGIVVHPGDPGALFQAIIRLFSDASLRARMGRAGHEEFAKHFTENHFRSRFLAALGLETCGQRLEREAR